MTDRMSVPDGSISQGDRRGIIRPTTIMSLPAAMKQSTLSMKTLLGLLCFALPLVFHVKGVDGELFRLQGSD